MAFVMYEPSQIHKTLPRLSTRLVSDFQNRYSEKFGKEISIGEAEAELLELAELIRITIRTQHVNEKNIKEGEENEK